MEHTNFQTRAERLAAQDALTLRLLNALHEKDDIGSPDVLRAIKIAEEMMAKRDELHEDCHG